LAKLKSATTTHDDLSREVKKADETYQLYAQKKEESRISDELDKQKISNVTIAEAAAVPRVPNKTNRPLTIVLGIVMGLILGIGCAIAAEFFRETIHTPSELEAFTGLPVIATVPMNSKRLRQLNFRVKTTKEDIIEPEIEEPIYVEAPPARKKQAVYAKY
jgi:polysaccharide biosynthesis transport protein